MTTAMDLSVSRLRRRSERLMPSSAVISRPVLANDGAGGRSTTWETVLSGVTCRLEEISLEDVERLAGSQAAGRQEMRLDVRKLARIVFPAGTDVRRDDRVTVVSRTFVVMDVGNTVDFEVHRSTLGLEL